MKRLGVAHLTALELPPEVLAHEAAAAGFTHVGLRLHPAMPGGTAYPLPPGSQALRALEQVLRGEGVGVNDIEFIELNPHFQVDRFEAMLDAGARLGACSLTVSGDDPEPQRLSANLARLCERAAGYGLRVNVEFMRWRQVANLQQAVALLEAASQPNSGLLIDALHLFRAGNTVVDLAAVAPAWLGDVQLCDAPLAAPAEALIVQEAREGRLFPGEGELPLAALMAALPAQVRVSVEAPVLGVGWEARLRQGAEAARRCLRA